VSAADLRTNNRQKVYICYVRSKRERWKTMEKANLQQHFCSTGGHPKSEEIPYAVQCQ
jgi:hypothetical protein